MAHLIDMSTVDARWNATTMLRQGKFARKVGLPATRNYDLVAIDDPFGVSTPAVLFWFRRPMPTANLRNHIVHWDSALTVGTDRLAGLQKQARANVTAAQQGGAPSDAVVAEIASYEDQLSHAQIILRGVGRLDADGARGGPAHAAAQPLVAGRFDLYDAGSAKYSNTSNSRNDQGTVRDSAASTVQDGATLQATLNTNLSTSTSHDGDRFTMTVSSPAQFEGAVIEGGAASQRSHRGNDR